MFFTHPYTHHFPHIYCNSKNNYKNNFDNVSASKPDESQNLSSNLPSCSNIGSSNVDIHDNISKKDSTKKQSSLLVIDSMLKHVNDYGLSKLTNHQLIVKSRFHPGAKICCFNDRIKTTIIHLETSSLASGKSPIQICNDLISLAASIQDNNINPIISLIVSHNDDLT